MGEYSTTRQQLLSFASSSMQRAENAANRAAGGYTSRSGSLSVGQGNALKFSSTLKPPKINGYTLPTADSITPSTVYRDTTAFDTRADAYIAKYFPSINACLRTVPDEWLCDILTGVDSFITRNPTFEALWRRAKDRTEREARVNTQTLRSTFSSRGFALPQGVMVAMEQESARTRLTTLGEVNRDILIKEADLIKEVTLFAEEQALKYKMGVFQAMGDMYKVWTQLYNDSLAKFEAQTRAYQVYIESIIGYSELELAFEKVRLSAAQSSAELEIKADAVAAQKDAAAGGSVASGLGTAAAGMASAAGVAANAASSLVLAIEGG